MKKKNIHLAQDRTASYMSLLSASNPLFPTSPSPSSSFPSHPQAQLSQWLSQYPPMHEARSPPVANCLNKCVLQVIYNLVVQRHHSCCLYQVFLNVRYLRLEPTKGQKGGELFGDMGSKCGCCRIFNVTQQVLNTDFFCFNSRWNVEECLSCLGSVLFKNQFLFLKD